MAQAWLDGQNKKDADLSVAQMEIVTEAVKITAVRQALFSPLLETKVKVDAITASGFSEPVRKIIGWIDSTHNWKKLSGFVWHAKNLLEHKAAARQAKVWSAVELTGKEKTLLLERLSKRFGQEIGLEAAVAPDLLGGLVVDFAGERIDASVRGKLNRIKENLLATNV